MLQRRSVVLSVAMVIVMLALVGCDTEATPTTSTTTTAALPVSTSEPPETTTATTAPIGPQPLPAGGFLEPGEYVTTVFEPVVMYRIESRQLLRPFQNDTATGLHNRETWFGARPPGVDAYKGVAIHNWWRGLTPEEVLTELEEIEQLALETPSETEAAGFPAIQISGTVTRRGLLWSEPVQTSADSFWALEPGQVMRFIILDTPAGSLLITVGADAEEWDEFLPVGEEVLAGISFPDID